MVALLGGGLDAGEFLLVVVPGQEHPAGKVTARAGVGGDHFSRLGQPLLPGGQVVLGQKAAQLGEVEF